MNLLNLIFVAITALVVFNVAKFVYTKVKERNIEDARRFAGYHTSTLYGNDREAPKLGFHENMFAITATVAASIGSIAVMILLFNVVGFIFS